MDVPSRSALVLGCSVLLASLAACTPNSPTGPQANAASAPAFDRGGPPSATADPLPSGTHIIGKAAVEPAYDDVTGDLIYILTPTHAPLPTHANPEHAVAPLYIVVYPPGSSVVDGGLNCEGVPGNCPDHDKAIADYAVANQPGVYGNDPYAVPGHDHLLAPPASGGDFNVSWEVWEVLFTNSAAANTHLTTEADVENAIARGDAIKKDLGFTFTCAVVSGKTYEHGTPVGG